MSWILLFLLQIHSFMASKPYWSLSRVFSLEPFFLWTGLRNELPFKTWFFFKEKCFLIAKYLPKLSEIWPVCKQRCVPNSTKALKSSHTHTHPGPVSLPLTGLGFHSRNWLFYQVTPTSPKFEEGTLSAFISHQHNNSNLWPCQVTMNKQSHPYSPHLLPNQRASTSKMGWGRGDHTYMPLANRACFIFNLDPSSP